MPAAVIVTLLICDVKTTGSFPEDTHGKVGAQRGSRVLSWSPASMVITTVFAPLFAHFNFYGPFTH